MGIGIGSRSSCSTNPSIDTNPDPINFDIQDIMQYPNGYVLQVLYPDCTNYEGMKILVFEGQYKFRTSLDPHFDADDDLSPVARFRPTKFGLMLASICADSL